MKLSEVKAVLGNLDRVDFQFEDGTFVAEHFHVTEVGQVTKKFIDCGGTMREEVKVSFQLWNADDYEHRLKAGKLLNIIRLSETKLGIIDGEIEVEVQGKKTIGKYFLAFNGTHFLLKNTLTACLAEDACGITPSSQAAPTSCCDPNAGCC
ncbi:hypothetical protein HX030_17065 [Myroides odoratimimus]|uniref:DUF6428 family protein n=1 Tax=Myroides odoratimimus TaxID=76832 RepID=UPI002097B976|nr:DUF6428 family protein [Myroides odoratimimus]MCO7724871.1 DUF6428 family protein [Myroides odoratimimus]MDM1412463.1 hypothetical protein [Myroides odoratimimus]MDM1465361.1 hypothetical protein [Myroides odoratimimus]MDM1468719.1 hypothetical protein [Myroides odoratimimus]MDM1472010.1 hypothetical protein [Myroides odoratimimus]